MVVIDDCTKDEQVNASPYVVASPHIRFYAGAALMVDGVKVRVVATYRFEAFRPCELATSAVN